MELQHPDTQPIYYVGLNKEAELVHITEQEECTNKQGGRTYCTQLDQGEEISLPSIGTVSVGVRNQVLNIWGQKVMVDIFCTQSTLILSLPRKALPQAMGSLTWHFHVNSMLPVMPSSILGLFCSPHRSLPFKYVCTHV